jgi:glycosyltransferase involved in cell wall biosynthesis
MDVNCYDWLARTSLRLSAFLSRFPDVIIANSSAGKGFHRSIGCNTNRMMVIPNGRETDRFKSNCSAGLRERDEWRIDEELITIGLVGYLDPMKDHTTFLK